MNKLVRENPQSLFFFSLQLVSNSEEQLNEYPSKTIILETQENLEKTTYTLTGKLVVTPSDVAQVIALWTGLPLTSLTRDQAQRFLHLEEEIANHIIGQQYALSVVSRALRRYAAGLRNPNRPIGSFLFCGPTGVGKTELTKQLAENLFSSQKSLIRLDMSEYMEKHTVARLIGSPPGYVGFNEGGQLTEAVRNRPYSLILFDEIEKAHPDVYNLLLQILDDGILSDASGRTVSFKNTLIILTSNLGSQTVLEFCAEKPVRTPEDEITLKKIVQQTLNARFRPEFLNRLDDVVVFHPLTKQDISSISFLLLDQINERLAQKGFKFLVTSRLLIVIRQEGFNPVYGARPLRRAISKWVEDPIAEKLLLEDKNLELGSTFVVDIERGEIPKPRVVVLRPEASKKLQLQNTSTNN